MHLFSWAIVVMFCVPVLMMVINVFFVNRRNEVIAQSIREKGYVLLNPPAEPASGGSKASLVAPRVRGLAGLRDIDGLDHGGMGFVCQLRGREVTIFNTMSSPPLNQSDAQGAVRYRIAKIKHDGLPRFSIGRHGTVELVQKLVDRLTHTTDARLDRTDVPGFFKRYWMKGPDASAAFAFLTPTKLRYLESMNFSGILASNAEYLVYFESQTRDMRTAAEYDRFIALIDGLIVQLL